MDHLWSLWHRVGRRGGVLFFIGVLDAIFSLSLWLITNPNNERLYGSYIPLNVWAVVWAVAGLVAWTSMFAKVDRLGFALSAAILTVWGILAALAWLQGDAPNGWLSATFFLVLDGLILVPASWPEPRRLMPVAVDESFPDAVITADDHGVITGWMGAAERMFGWTAAEVVGHSISMVIPIKYRVAHNQGISRVRTTGRSKLAGKLLRAEGLHKDGSEFPVNVMIGVHHTEAGIILSTTVSTRRDAS